MLVFFLIACQEPFDVDRHDLVGDRVAAIEVYEEAGGLRPRLAMVHDGKPWADALPELAWSFVPAGDDDAAWSVEAGDAGVGPRPLLEPTDARLVLVATWPSGEERHVVDLTEVEAPPSIGSVTLGQVVEAPAVEASLAPADRAAWVVEPAATVSPEGVAELAATSNGTVRWMATGGAFLELDRTTTHWWPGDFLRDDEVLEAVTPGTPGVVTVVAAAVGGGVRFTATDVVVGEALTGGFTTTGRFLPADAELPSGLVQGVLEADDSAPSGVRMVLLGAVDDSVDPGTSGLCALPHEGPFDPTWLLDGTCLRSEVVGATVVVELR